MASSSNQQIKRLSELLNEQQEPFVLEIYLLERGCHFRKYSSAQFSSIARNVFNKIVFKKWRKKKRKKDKELVSDPTIGRRSSSFSFSTTFSTSTWSNSDAHDADADADITHNQCYNRPCMLTIVRVLYSISCGLKDQLKLLFEAQDMLYTLTTIRNCIVNGQPVTLLISQDYKQCSCNLISFLEEIDLIQAVPVYNVRQTHEEMLAGAGSKNRFQNKVPEDSILSDSLWEMLVQVRRQNLNKNRKRHIRKPFPNFNSKQLLFECETKIVEDRNQQNRNSYKGLIMGSQEIGWIVCRNLKMWGKLSAHETNIQQVLRMDLLEDVGKYNDVWRKGIGREIGNGIFDEIIQEIIRDLCYHY